MYKTLSESKRAHARAAALKECLRSERLPAAMCSCGKSHFARKSGAISEKMAESLEHGGVSVVDDSAVTVYDFHGQSFVDGCECRWELATSEMLIGMREVSTDFFRKIDLLVEQAPAEEQIPVQAKKRKRKKSCVLGLQVGQIVWSKIHETFVVVGDIEKRQKHGAEINSLIRIQRICIRDFSEAGKCLAFFDAIDESHLLPFGNIGTFIDSLVENYRTKLKDAHDAVVMGKAEHA
jgi:hypothetical protein